MFESIRGTDALCIVPPGFASPCITDSVAPHLLEQNVLARFSREDCIPIDANSVEQAVQFKDGSSLKDLQGKKAVLLLELLDADLYGFRIK